MSSADMTSWPFWAPSDLESMRQALDLAGIVPGETVVDLGCGDGQVLVVAARQGATVIGVESDGELVDLANEALDAEDLDGEVIQGDLFEVVDGLEGVDVWFTYLSPASLQRLLPALSRRRGSRLVTVDFDVPGLVIDDQSSAARLYRLPGRRRRRPSRPGWTCDGALVIAPPGHQSLTVLDLHHPGGHVSASLVGEAQGAAALLTGADEALERELLAVDLRWNDHPQGTVLVGGIEVDGLAPFPLFTVFDTDSEEGCWELTDEGVTNVRNHLRRADGVTSGEAIVRAAEG